MTLQSCTPLSLGLAITTIGLVSKVMFPMGRFLALVVCEARQAAAHPDSCHVPRVARYWDWQQQAAAGDCRPTLECSHHRVTFVQHLHHPAFSHAYFSHVEGTMK